MLGVFTFEFVSLLLVDMQPPALREPVTDAPLHHVNLREATNQLPKLHHAKERA
jgi:hypothetical protein